MKMTPIIKNEKENSIIPFEKIPPNVLFIDKEGCYCIKSGEDTVVQLLDKTGVFNVLVDENDETMDFKNIWGAVKLFPELEGFTISL